MKEFLSKEVSGRKVELDELIVPSLNLESSTSEKSIPMMPTPTREEENDNDQETWSSSHRSHEAATGVSYEDALLRFRFEVIRLKPFDISITSPNFKK